MLICAVACLLSSSAWPEESAKSAGEPAGEGQASADTLGKPAETAAGGEEAGQAGQGLFVDLGEIIVSATGNRKMLKDAPGSVTVVGRDEIRSMANQIGDVGSALDAQTGVRIQRYGGMGHGTSIRVRGTKAEQTLVLVDGRPVNSPSLAEADLSWLDADEIDRIEIVRGPMSALHGGHAVGGTVNIITRRPPEEMETKVTGAYGTDATRIGHLMHGATIDRFGYLIQGSFRETNGYRSNSEDRDRSLRMALTYDLDLVRATVDVAHQDRWLERPGARPRHDRENWWTGQERISNNSARTLFDHAKERRWVYSAELAGDNWAVKGWRNEWTEHSWAQGVASYYPNARPGSAGSREQGDQFTSSRFKTDSWGADAHYTFVPVLRNQFTVGGAYKREDFGVSEKQFNAPDYPVAVSATRNVSSGLNPVIESGEWSANRQTWSVFAQDEIDLDPVTLTLGARRDMPDDYHHRWTWRANAVWDVTEKTRLRGGYGQAYRPPSLNDLHWPDSDMGVGNSELQPETSWSWEAGVEHEFGEIWVSRLTFWQQKIKNAIEWQPVGEMGLWGPKWEPNNLNVSYFRGIELENRVKVVDNLTLYGGATYLLKRETHEERAISQVTDATERLHCTTSNTPLYTVDLGLDWQDLIWEGLRLNFDAHFVGNRKLNYVQYDQWPRLHYRDKNLSAFFLLNGRISQRLDVEFAEIEVFFAVSNILNKDYATRFGRFTDRGYPAPPRQFLLGASMKF